MIYIYIYPAEGVEFIAEEVQTRRITTPCVPHKETPCVPHKEGATIPSRKVPKMGGTLGKYPPFEYRTSTGFRFTKEVRHQAEDVVLPHVTGCDVLEKIC